LFGALALPMADICEFLGGYDSYWGAKPPSPPVNYAYGYLSPLEV